MARTILGAGLLLVATLFSTGAAAASEGDARLTLRLFAGLQNGGSLSVASGDRLFAAEVAQAFLPGRRLGSLSEVSLIARTRDPGAWVGARAGYQLGVFTYDAAPRRDASHTFDVGLIGGLASQAGHSLVIEAGAERVSRAEPFICCDSVLERASVGARLMLAGQVALGPKLALFGRLGLRTAEHVLEIGVLPVLMAGVAVNL
jgi:hypothetical protein